MDKYKICIWMNAPSHHQSAFFQALAQRKDIDLKVVYLSTQSSARVAQGWKDQHSYQPYEASLPINSSSPESMLAPVPDWPERVHLICSYFGSSLIGFFCEKRVAWCHWSEAPGYRLAELLGYRMAMFRIFYPLMLLCKRKDGRCIDKHALGVFAQGALARRAFRWMGVPHGRIADLFYAPAALQPMDPLARVVQFARGRKVFLAAAALCRRKGIDVLLKAFARLKTTDWCLVLCGLDRSNGAYQTLSSKLGIEDSVLFLGVHPSERIAEVYAAAHVFVLPSRFDGWGAVLNEAASLGLPLIATDQCGAAWHVIEQAENGYRVRAGSVNALAVSMATYTVQPQLVKLHGGASRQRFYERIAPEKNAERLVNALQHWGHE